MVMETIRDNGHSDRVVKKCQRIAGLKALLKEWELSGDLDLDYIRGLKARLLSVQNQLKNMCGSLIFDIVTRNGDALSQTTDERIYLPAGASFMFV